MRIGPDPGGRGFGISRSAKVVGAVGTATAGAAASTPASAAASAPASASTPATFAVGVVGLWRAQLKASATHSKEANRRVLAILQDEEEAEVDAKKGRPVLIIELDSGVDRE